MGKSLSISHKIAFAAMLLAFNVLVTRLLGLAQPGPIFSFNRLGVSGAIVIYSSLFLGPLFGAIVGVAGDAIGWLLLGQWTGTFNVYLSIYFALIGILPYFLVKVFKSHLDSKVSIGLLFATLIALFAAMQIFLWTDGNLASRIDGWNVNLLGARTFVTSLSGAFFIGLFVFLILFGLKKRDKNIGKIYWCSLLVELLSIFFKPLCFYLYCLTFLGTNIEEAWHVSYSMLVMLSCLFAFADIILNVAFLRLLFWVGGKVIRDEQA